MFGSEFITSVFWKKICSGRRFVFHKVETHVPLTLADSELGKKIIVQNSKNKVSKIYVHFYVLEHFPINYTIINKEFNQTST